MDDDELLRELQKAVAGQRAWANFFWWYDRSSRGKALAECGAVQDLFASLEAVGRAVYANPRPSNDQWPDCEATRSDGRLVAIEVSELVDAATLAERNLPQPWNAAQLTQVIQARITGKDRRSFHGGKYAEVILLLHTDEFFLVPEATIALLRDASFKVPHGNIDHVFLLFSYWPELGRCPVAELTLLR